MSSLTYVNGQTVDAPNEGQCEIHDEDLSRWDMHTPKPFLSAAARLHDCPVKGLLMPDLHPDFTYEVWRDEGKDALIIRWSRLNKRGES